MTLRITGENGPHRVKTLRLEGRVVGEWVALLERECARALRSRRPLKIDLAGVSFIDRAGVEALVRLSRAGVAIHCRTRLVASVLEEDGICVVLDAEDADNGHLPAPRPSERGPRKGVI